MRSIFAFVAALPLVTACGSNSNSSPESGGDGSTSSGTVSTSASQICVDTINQYRATLSLPAYSRWTGEETCASTEAETDSKSGVAHSAFGTCGEFAQDECPGWPGPPEKMIPACLAMMWAEGPGTDFSKHGHYINMSNPKYTMAACGFFVLPNGNVWAAQNFK